MTSGRPLCATRADSTLARTRVSKGNRSVARGLAQVWSTAPSMVKTRQTTRRRRVAVADRALRQVATWLDLRLLPLTNLRAAIGKLKATDRRRGTRSEEPFRYRQRGVWYCDIPVRDLRDLRVLRLLAATFPDLRLVGLDSCSAALLPSKRCGRRPTAS